MSSTTDHILVDGDCHTAYLVPATSILLGVRMIASFPPDSSLMEAIGSHAPGWRVWRRRALRWRRRSFRTAFSLRAGMPSPAAACKPTSRLCRPRPLRCPPPLHRRQRHLQQRKGRRRRAGEGTVAMTPRRIVCAGVPSSGWPLRISRWTPSTRASCSRAPPWSSRRPRPNT